MKTYIPKLVAILRLMCKYIAKYRDTIIKVIGNEHAPALDALVDACNVIMPILEEFLPTPH